MFYDRRTKYVVCEISSFTVIHKYLFVVTNYGAILSTRRTLQEQNTSGRALDN